MLLHNIGSKIINVGTTILMPGDSMNITEETSNLPAIKAFCEMGFTLVEKDKVQPANASADAAAADDAAPVAAKRGRKPASASESEQQ